MGDPYANELAELFRRFDLPGDPAAEDALTAEFKRRGLTVDQSQRVDFSTRTGGAVYGASLRDADGAEVAYSVGDHPRQAAINALRRFLEGRHARDI